MPRINITLLTLLTGYSSIALGTPPWASENTQVRSGSTFKVVCSGIGPSLDLARSSAINSCKQTTSDQLNVNTTVKNLYVETERDVAIHQEVKSETKIVGLRCDPEKEAIEENKDSYKVWLRCSFDLTKAKVVPLDHPDDEVQIVQERTITVEKNASRDNKSTTIKSATFETSEVATLSLATIPQCIDLIVQGKRSRTIKCQSNPVIVTLFEGDKRITVRASGYKPKTIEVSPTGKGEISAQIIFD